MSGKPSLLKLTDKTIHSFGTLPLSSGKRRRNKGHIPMSQIQQMPRHKSSHFCVVLINSIYCTDFFFVANDDQRNASCHLFYLADIVRVGIAGINDPLGCHGADHPQIFLLKSCITLGIADENSVATLVGYRLDSLKEHHIVRAGNSWAKDNNHFFLFVLFFIFVARKLIAQFSGHAFHFFHCFSGKRNIVLMVQNHGNRCLGNSRFLCHI